MGKCVKCGKRIEYNQYKIIKGKVYCLGCAKEYYVPVPEATEHPMQKVVENIILPTKKAEKEMEKYGVSALEVIDALTTTTRKSHKKRKYKKRK